MEAGHSSSPVTRKSLAHATIDFLDGTKQRLEQLTMIDQLLDVLHTGKRPVDTRLLTQGLQEQAVLTANDMLTALGGVAILLQTDEDSNQYQIVRLNALRNFASPEGPPTWLISASPKQFGELTLDFSDAKEQLQE